MGRLNSESKCGVPGLIPAFVSLHEWAADTSEVANQPKGTHPPAAHNLSVPIPCVSFHAAAVLIVCTILAGCASSGSTQGPSGPLDSISEVNEALGKYSLTAFEGVPVLAGPQR